MKKFLFMLAAIAVTAFFVSCSDDEDDVKGSGGSGSGSGGSGGTTEEGIHVFLSVTDIADNQATINISLTSGEAYGAQLVEAVRSSEVTVDYTSEIQLINYVRENGIDIDLPYTNTVTGLKADAEMFTAVIVFNANGLASTSAYRIWTAVGMPEAWSDDNSAGDLDEKKW